MTRCTDNPMIRFLSHFYQPISSLPVGAQVIHDSLAVIGTDRRTGIGFFYDSVSLCPRQLKQLFIPDWISDAEAAPSGLLRSRHLSRAPNLQVEFCDFKSVLSTHHFAETALGFGRHLATSHQDTIGLGCAASNAPAKLV